MKNALTRQMQASFSQLMNQLICLMGAPAPKASLYRVEQPMPSINLLGFLAAQPMENRAYWQDREGECEIAAFGQCWRQNIASTMDIAPVFQYARNLLEGLSEPDSCQCLSYLSFSDSTKSVWPEFGYGAVFLPAVELVKRKADTVLGVNLLAGNEKQWQQSLNQAISILQAMIPKHDLENRPFHLETAGFQPTRKQWCQLVEIVSSNFSSGADSCQLDKVVLSREARFHLAGDLSPWVLIDAWRKANPNSYAFLFTPNSSHNHLTKNSDVFLGCSPERLIKRQDRIINTEALAGTSRRGKDQHEDFQFEVLLMNDRKNIHENRLVLDDIRRQLSPLCESLQADSYQSVLKLETIQHLRHLVHGVLKDNVFDEQLIAALHPTPAVGGAPRDKAREFIEAYEPYSRGLYAGACGVLGTQSSEFSVAIRSARLTSDCLSLFSGSGIVRGSVARDEWQELDSKIATAKDAIARLQSRDIISKNHSDAICFGSN